VKRQLTQRQKLGSTFVAGCFIGAVASPSHVEQPKESTISIRCQVHGALPDRSCTPGATDPRVTQENLATTICRPGGYTKSVRHTSQALKNRVMEEYGFTPGEFDGEIDHLIPLSLGGADTQKNLWPQEGEIPNAKDTKVEGVLRRAVCKGTVTLKQAQVALATNWTTAANQVKK
jgi:hypothetical protein